MLGGVRRYWPSRRGWRIAATVTSALVLVFTGIAHGLYSDLADGLVRTRILGASDGGPLNILLVGVDSRTDAQGNELPRQLLAELRSGAEPGVLNSDTIILLHVPAGGSGAIAISIPRDSYVDIPDYRRDKINAAYPASKAIAADALREKGLTDDAMIDRQAAEEGRKALVQTVERLTGASIDHYAEVNLLGFYNLTNAIGGVEVCLRRPVREPFSGANFPAGRQTISGGAALAFVRQRYELPEGDISRIRRQQVFLAALANKITSAGTLTDAGKLQSLINVAKQSVVLDAGFDPLALAGKLSELAGGGIEFVTIPTRGAETNARGDVLLVDRFEVQGFVSRITGERGRDQAESSSRPAVPPSSVVVDVLNTTGTTGLAATVAEGLRGSGYLPGSVGNSPNGRTSSIVAYSSEADEAAAGQVAEALGGLSVRRDASLPAGRVRVLLGSDYAAGTGAASISASPPAAPSGGPDGAGPAPITADGVPCVD